MIELIHGDCMDDLQAGKAGEYLVCADLILQGFVAYPSEQGLPYDVVMDYNGRLIKVQVKATRGLRAVANRKIPIRAYQFNVKRRGKKNSKEHTKDSCHLFALVALDTKEIGYLPNCNVRQTMNFRPSANRGIYKDENTNRKVTGTYLTDLTLQKALCQI